MSRLLYLLLFILPIGCFAGTTPFSVADGFIITEARICGKDVLVILDSGAPGLVLNENYYSSKSDENMTCVGINGSYTCQTLKINDWNWLGIHFRKTNALVSDLSFLERKLNKAIHGVIGLSVLTEYYVTIDFDRQFINLSKKKEDIAPVTFSRFQYVDHLPVIKCKVNGNEKVLGLDTGSESNYLFGSHDDFKTGFENDAKPVLVTGSENEMDLKHELLMNLTLDGRDITYHSGFVVDLDDQGYLNPELFNGLLGQSFLSNFNWIIHPGKQKICLTPRFHNSSPEPSFLVNL